MVDFYILNQLGTCGNIIGHFFSFVSSKNRKARKCLKFPVQMLLLVRFRQMISWILSFIIRFKYQQIDLKSDSNINIILDPDYFLFWIRISSTFGSRLLLILDPDFFWFWIHISSVLNPDFFCFWIQISSAFESRFLLILNPDFMPKAPVECTAPPQGHPGSLQNKKYQHIHQGCSVALKKDEKFSSKKYQHIHPGCGCW